MSNKFVTAYLGICEILTRVGPFIDPPAFLNGKAQICFLLLGVISLILIIDIYLMELNTSFFQEQITRQVEVELEVDLLVEVRL